MDMSGMMGSGDGTGKAMLQNLQRSAMSPLPHTPTQRQLATMAGNGSGGGGSGGMGTASTTATPPGTAGASNMMPQHARSAMGNSFPSPRAVIRPSLASPSLRMGPHPSHVMSPGGYLGSPQPSLYSPSPQSNFGAASPPPSSSQHQQQQQKRMALMQFRHQLQMQQQQFQGNFHAQHERLLREQQQTGQQTPDVPRSLSAQDHMNLSRRILFHTMQRQQQQQQQQQQGRGSSTSPGPVLSSVADTVAAEAISEHQERITAAAQATTTNTSSSASPFLAKPSAIQRQSSNNTGRTLPTGNSAVFTVTSNSTTAPPKTTSDRAGISSPPLPLLHPPPQEIDVVKFLNQCDWKDKVIYVARQLLGGSTVNGFQRATSAAQKIKKQRQRQVALANAKRESKAAEEAAQNATPAGQQLQQQQQQQPQQNQGDYLTGASTKPESGGTGTDTDGDNSHPQTVGSDPSVVPSTSSSTTVTSSSTSLTTNKQQQQQQHGNNNNKNEATTNSSAVASEQEAEEQLKIAAMNPRMAKKIKDELTMGMEFCNSLRDYIHMILAEIDPNYKPEKKEEEQEESCRSKKDDNSGGGNGAVVAAANDDAAAGAAVAAATSMGSGFTNSGITALNFGGERIPWAPSSGNAASAVGVSADKFGNDAMMMLKMMMPPPQQQQKFFARSGNSSSFLTSSSTLNQQQAQQFMMMNMSTTNASSSSSLSAAAAVGMQMTTPPTLNTCESSSASQQQHAVPKKTLELTREASMGDSSAGSNEQQRRNSQNPLSPGDPGGSQLRKLRKRIPGITDAKESPEALGISLYDEQTKRKLNRKELAYRCFEVTRFRTLKEGDYVAARVTSRDLWILARVVKEYPALDVSPSELLSMSEARRELLFRDRVYVQDVEEYDGDIQKAKAVPRNLILPLPRSFTEAADWGTRCRRGTRIYAMYPHTTSLYCGTVVDGTTYCNGDDDIVVVEFDGEEKDQGGSLPQFHIPARFVTLIPREFPAAQTTKKKKSSKASAVLPVASPGEAVGSEPSTFPSSDTSTTKSKKSSSGARERKHAMKDKASTELKRSKGDFSSDDALNDMISEMEHDSFVGDAGLESFEKFEFGLDLSAEGAPDSGSPGKSKKSAQKKRKGQGKSAAAPAPDFTGLSGSNGAGAESASKRVRSPKGKQPPAKQQTTGFSVGNEIPVVTLGMDARGMYNPVPSADSLLLADAGKKTKRTSSSELGEKGRRKKQVTGENPLGSSKSGSKKKGTSAGDPGGGKKVNK